MFRELKIAFIAILIISPSLASSKSSIERRYEESKQKYLTGEISKATLWQELHDYYSRIDEFSRPGKISLIQSMAKLAYEQDLLISSAIFSSQAIRFARNPIDKVLYSSWKVLFEISKRQPIDNIYQELAASFDANGNEIPVFKSDWNYFVGNAYFREAKYKEALIAYGKVDLYDFHYYHAKFHEAIIHAKISDYHAAEVSLKKILLPTSQEVSVLSDEAKNKILDIARLTLARIYYSQKQFEKSIQAYRTISKDSPNYYDSMFEQSWAFFMGGYPNHALGALHSVESPFFKDRFNPEAPILRSMIYFWLCQYDYSRNALADFVEKHEKVVKSISAFVDRSRFTGEQAYILFENLVSGVSSEALGIPRYVLNSAATKDSMRLARHQLASVIEEKLKLREKGVYGNTSAINHPTRYLEQWETYLRKELGEILVSELKIMRDDYKRLHEQAQFLYVELLMSEKDQLLGTELHADKKMTKVSTEMNVAGWGRKNDMAWTKDDKQEFWWDEIGFYVFQEQSKCKVN